MLKTKLECLLKWNENRSCNRNKYTLGNFILFLLQFIDSVDRGSLGNARLLPHAKMLLVPINL